MKIKTLFKTIFCAGLVLTLVLYLCHLYGNYICLLYTSDAADD